MQTEATVAIIGGTGLYDLGAPGDAAVLRTPYGEAAYFRLELDGQPVVFLTRHGVGHSVPPHRVNYRANIWALHALGVREVLATQAVGSMNPAMRPGHFTLLGQFIDWTKNRPFTFFDGDDIPVLHVDVTAPYCPRMTATLCAAGKGLGGSLHAGAVYACMEGPRFETAAEIRALRLLGADVVGMTNVPEVVLAREAGLCYAAICIICNWAAGIADQPLTHHEVLDIMATQSDALINLIRGYLRQRSTVTCSCEELGFGRYLPEG